MLTIQWEDSRNRCSDANGIVRIIKDRLSEFGYDGVWKVVPATKTGIACQPFTFKRIFNDVHHGMRLEVYCRPGDRDTSWEVAIYPPSNYQIEDVAANLGGSPIDVAPTQPKDDSKLAIGQILQAKVERKLEYGLLVRVLEFDKLATIPLEHIDGSGQYDINILNKYKIGDTIRASIKGVRPKLIMSILGAQLTTNSDCVADTFTGIPNTDGVLNLGGYSTGSSSIERKLQILKWLGEEARSRYPQPIPKSDALLIVSTGLVELYNAKDVRTRHVGMVIKALTREHWIEYGEDTITITQTGWDELGGIPIASENIQKLAKDISVASASMVLETVNRAESDLKVERLRQIVCEIGSLEVERRQLEEWFVKQVVQPSQK